MRALWLCVIAALIRGVIAAEPEASTNRVQKIDLPTTLRLAGARNLDVQIARERLAEARANLDASVWQFFPRIPAGAGYRRHEILSRMSAAPFLTQTRNRIRLVQQLVRRLILEMRSTKISPHGNSPRLPNLQLRVSGKTVCSRPPMRISNC
jgi:hypothetical protein